jgi:hypothetical protein
MTHLRRRLIESRKTGLLLLRRRLYPRSQRLWSGSISDLSREDSRSFLSLTRAERRNALRGVIPTAEGFSELVATLPVAGEMPESNRSKKRATRLNSNGALCRSTSEAGRRCARRASKSRIQLPGSRFPDIWLQPDLRNSGLGVEAVGHNFSIGEADVPKTSWGMSSRGVLWTHALTMSSP